MSGKLMKKLRRQAEVQTIGKPWISIEVNPIVEDRIFKKPTGAVELRHSPRSGKGIYQQLKKEH